MQEGCVVKNTVHACNHSGRQPSAPCCLLLPEGDNVLVAQLTGPLPGQHLLCALREGAVDHTIDAVRHHGTGALKEVLCAFGIGPGRQQGDIRGESTQPTQLRKSLTCSVMELVGSMALLAACNESPVLAKRSVCRPGRRLAGSSTMAPVLCGTCCAPPDKDLAGDRQKVCRRVAQWELWRPGKPNKANWPSADVSKSAKGPSKPPRQ